MNKENKGPGWFIVFCAFIIGFTVGGNISDKCTQKAIENEAVENGVAYYNQTNKVFTWKNLE